MNTNVIFQGVKFFWKTRNTVDVTLVDHSLENITEIVVYDPSIDREAPRIYLDSQVLYSKLNPVDIQAQLSFGQRNGVLVTEQNIVNRGKFDYLVNRLFLSEYRADARIIKANLQISCMEGNFEELCRVKPVSLLPFLSPHQRELLTASVDAFKKVMGLGDSSGEPHDPVHLEPEHSTRELTVWERWRIPIVFVKVAKNRCLSPSDSRIWHNINAKMKAQSGTVHAQAVTATPQIPLKKNYLIANNPSVQPKTAARRNSEMYRQSSDPSHAPVQNAIGNRRNSELPRQQSDPSNGVAQRLYATNLTNMDLPRQRFVPLNDATISTKSAVVAKKPSKAISKKVRRFSKMSTVAVEDNGYDQPTQTAQSSASGSELLALGAQTGDEMGDETGDEVGAKESDGAPASAIQSLLSAALGTITFSVRSGFGLSFKSASVARLEVNDACADADVSADVSAGAVQTAKSTPAVTSATCTEASMTTVTVTETSSDHQQVQQVLQMHTESSIRATAESNCGAGTRTKQVNAGIALSSADSFKTATAGTGVTGIPPRLGVVRLLSQLRMSFAGSSDSGDFPRSPLRTGAATAAADGAAGGTGGGAAITPVFRGPFPLVQMVMASFGSQRIIVSP